MIIQDKKLGKIVSPPIAPDNPSHSPLELSVLKKINKYIRYLKEKDKDFISFELVLVEDENHGNKGYT